jgi:hypothetical protein
VDPTVGSFVSYGHEILEILALERRLNNLPLIAAPGWGRVFLWKYGYEGPHAELLVVNKEGKKCKAIAGYVKAGAAPFEQAAIEEGDTRRLTVRRTIWLLRALRVFPGLNRRP